MHKIEEAFGKDVVILFEGGGNYVVAKSITYKCTEFCVIIGEDSILLAKGVKNQYMTLEEFLHIEDCLNSCGSEEEYEEKSFHYQGNYYDLVVLNGEYLEKTALLEEFDQIFQDEVLELYNIFRHATGSNATYRYK